MTINFEEKTIKELEEIQESIIVTLQSSPHKLNEETVKVLVKGWNEVKELIEKKKSIPQTLQLSFNPIKSLEWSSGWYNWDSKQAHKNALKARNQEAKRLKGLGYTVRKSTLKNQLMSTGGIGSGNPHIETVVNVYMINATLEQ